MGLVADLQILHATQAIKNIHTWQLANNFIKYSSIQIAGVDMVMEDETIAIEYNVVLFDKRSFHYERQTQNCGNFLLLLVDGVPYHYN